MLLQHNYLLFFSQFHDHEIDSHSIENPRILFSPFTKPLIAVYAVQTGITSYHLQ